MLYYLRTEGDIHDIAFLDFLVASYSVYAENVFSQTIRDQYINLTHGPLAQQNQVKKC